MKTNVILHLAILGILGVAVIIVLSYRANLVDKQLEIIEVQGAKTLDL